MKSKNVLNKVVNVCGKVMGERPKQLSQLYERRVVWNARMIVEDNSHVLAKHYELLLRKTHGFRTFSCFGPYIWNSLQQDLRHCSTLSS